MKPAKSDVDTKRFRRLISVLRSLGKVLRESGSDRDLLSDFERLMAFLDSARDEEIQEILHGQPHQFSLAPRRQPASTELELRDDELLKLSTDKILQIVADPKQNRQAIERIASVRFGVSRGALSNLGGRAALVEKIRTLVRNEEAHRSIERLAGAKQHESDPKL